MARILAVDDERAILDAIARVLGRDGHEVVKAADPTAVPGMDLSRFDLVLCDVMMPGLRARPPCRLQGRERPRGLRLARQQPLGRRGGHHRGPPVRGLTTQALAPACLATKRFHLETRGVNRETTGERE